MKKTGLLLSTMLLSLHLCAATVPTAQNKPISFGAMPSCQTVKYELDFINKMKLSINQERNLIAQQLTRRERDVSLLIRQLSEISPIISTIEKKIKRSSLLEYLKEINETKTLLNSQITPIQHDLELLLNKVTKTNALIDKLKNKTLLPKHYTATAYAFQVENSILLSEIKSIQSMQGHLTSELKDKTTTLHSMSEKIKKIKKEKWDMLKNYQSILTKEIVLSRRTVNILKQATYTTYTTYMELNMKSLQLNKILTQKKCTQDTVKKPIKSPKINTKNSTGTGTGKD